MIYAGLYVRQLRRGKSVGLTDHALGPVVLVPGVDVLEENGVGAGEDGHVDPFRAKIIYRRHIGGRQRGDELEANIEIRKRVGKIKGGTACHVHNRSGGHYFVVGNMSDAAEFYPVHPTKIVIFWLKKLASIRILCIFIPK